MNSLSDFTSGRLKICLYNTHQPEQYRLPKSNVWMCSKFKLSPRISVYDGR